MSTKFEEATSLAPERGTRQRRARHNSADLDAAKSFMQLADLMQVRLNEVSNAHDMTPQQGHLLLLAEGLAMGAVAERMGCDPSNVTGLADRLQERGLVERHRSSSDRRVSELTRTPAGERLLLAMETELFADLPIYQGLTGRERAELQRILGKVAASHNLAPL
ncbi:MAG: hypothetical protein JJLCMIEE_03114 [Acidimicrobiales bacterium]|nr:MAG: MarR family transcriptional regulator [Actinomycetota bacterium]MBV6509995.1 hypothetical protein [Acidimicrobiales bacterium]RIK04313.1 MAG: hypothetical protein DCC48_13815 [Acidobacteriota bacterium]